MMDEIKLVHRLVCVILIVPVVVGAITYVVADRQMALEVGGLTLILGATVVTVYLIMEE